MNTHTEAFPCSIQPDEPVYSREITPRINETGFPRGPVNFLFSRKKSNGIILSY